jgi:sortase A
VKIEPRWIAAALILPASWQAAAALYIPAKAWVAQRLLERAWSQAADGNAAARPWPWADTRPVAHLRARDRRADLIVLQGASGRTLAFGPALVDGSAAPGERGTTLIAGHRDTHFRFLRELRIGDEIELESARGVRERFVVRLTEIVDSRASELRIDPSRRRLVLVTCYPFDAVAPGGPLRYVVVAEAAGAASAAIADRA